MIGKRDDREAAKNRDAANYAAREIESAGKLEGLREELRGASSRNSPTGGIDRDTRHRIGYAGSAEYRFSSGEPKAWQRDEQHRRNERLRRAAEFLGQPNRVRDTVGDSDGSDGA
jgi:hypothetical protein